MSEKIKTEKEWLFWQNEVRCSDYELQICKNDEIIIHILKKILLTCKNILSHFEIKKKVKN